MMSKLPQHIHSFALRLKLAICNSSQFPFFRLLFKTEDFVLQAGDRIPYSTMYVVAGAAGVTCSDSRMSMELKGRTGKQLFWSKFQIETPFP
jgi:hypothetical protein